MIVCGRKTDPSVSGSLLKMVSHQELSVASTIMLRKLHLERGQIFTKVNLKKWPAIVVASNKVGQPIYYYCYYYYYFTGHKSYNLLNIAMYEAVYLMCSLLGQLTGLVIF